MAGYIAATNLGQPVQTSNESQDRTFQGPPESTENILECSDAIDTFQRDRGVWTTSNISVNELLDATEKPEIRLVYLSYGFLATNPRLFRRFSNHFMIPSYYWASVCVESMGYFGCQQNFEDNGETKGYASWIQFIIKQPTSCMDGLLNRVFVWHKVSFYAYWASPQNTTVLCFNLQPAMRDRFQLHLEETIDNSNLYDPYSFYVPLMREVLSLFDSSIWSLRDMVRFIELNRVSTMPPQPDYPKLHELGRHIIHSSEAIDVAIESFTSLIAQHDLFSRQHIPKHHRAFSGKTRNQEFLNFQLSVLKSLRLRSQAIQARLQNEINLQFNLVGQYNSRISARIGQAAQSDSAAMKTISILTLVFLPGTFISAVFGTSFFGHGDNSPWTISNDFWIFWAILIPVTVATILFWYIWERFYSNQSNNKVCH